MKQEMQSNKLSGNKPTASTQAYLDIAEIKESVIILRDGSLRAVLVVSSTNFSLKSTVEQNSLISAYQNFLNGLDFSIQILMQSRKLDIHGYLDKLRATMQQQSNELLRLQTEEYIEYITKLIEFASIMNKTFYVVIPMSVEAVKKGFFSRLASLTSPGQVIKLEQQTFEKNREELIRRTNQVSSGLNSMSLQCISLNTEELIELLYNSYNLGNASPLKIGSVEDIELSPLE